MGNLATTLLAPQGPLMHYAEGLLKDVPADKFARLPEGKSGPIQTNHPAFAFGHLSLYPERVMTILGVQDSGIKNPPGFAEVFEAGKECLDDPKGKIYPGKEAVMTHFFDAHKRMFAKIAELPDEQLAKPHGLESDFARKFPTRAAMAAFLVGPHPFMHIGQLSAWRRCMGLGPCF